MARAKGQAAFAKFGDEKRDEYLAQLRSGCRRSTAARNVGVSRELVRLYRHATPGFAAEESAAEEEATDRVEDALFKAATAGNVTACQVWLYNRRSERWKDQRNLKVSGLEDVLSRLPPDFAAEVRRALALPVPGGNGEDAG